LLVSFVASGVEIITGKERCRRSSDEERRRLVTETFALGNSGSACDAAARSTRWGRVACTPGQATSTVTGWTWLTSKPCRSRS
jgi:hypothetical protein